MGIKLLWLQRLLLQVSKNRRIFQKDFFLSKITGQQSLTAPKHAEIVPHGWSVHAASFTGSRVSPTTLAQLIGAVTDSVYS